MAGLDDALAPIAAWIEDTLLVDTVRVARPGTGEPVLDEDTGRLTYPARGTVYEGPGAVQATATQAGATAALGATQPWTQETRSPYRLLTPLSAPIPARDDVVTVVAVHDPARAALLDREWVCVDAGAASTVEVVRITGLDQQVVPRTAAGGTP